MEGTGSSEVEEWDKKVEVDWSALLGGRKIRGLDSEYWKDYSKKVSTPIILGFGMHECFENILKV